MWTFKSTIILEHSIFNKGDKFQINGEWVIVAKVDVGIISYGIDTRKPINPLKQSKSMNEAENLHYIVISCP